MSEATLMILDVKKCGKTQQLLLQLKPEGSSYKYDALFVTRYNSTVMLLR